jgi:hypothetical protein
VIRSENLSSRLACLSISDRIVSEGSEFWKAISTGTCIGFPLSQNALHLRLLLRGLQINGFARASPVCFLEMLADLDTGKETYEAHPSPKRFPNHAKI